MTEPTLDTLTTSRLAELYNEHANKLIKRFPSKTAAILRIERLCAERGLRIVTNEGGDARLVPAADSPPQAPRSAAGDDPEPADPTPKRRRRGGERRAPQAAEADVPEAAVIRVVELPGAREGSHRAARMAALRDGMTPRTRLCRLPW